ncbi:MAG: serine/threonine-protein phosphatase [Muribaculaceae bacterium]|nr:serine/threonine-protein phosphatase [Muribaculaceae bacterium]
MQIFLKQARSFHQLGERANQEDARYPDYDFPPADQRVFVVCDGVGGHDCGEIASASVCRGFAEYTSDERPDLSYRIKDFQYALGQAYHSLYQEIERTGITNMGTTLTFAFFHADGVTLAHMGDSRIYQIRPGIGVIYRSNDHSLVGELVRKREMTQAEAEASEFGNVITRCITAVPEGRDFPKAEIYESNDVQPGDIFLLCTDGVLSSLPESDLVTFLANPQASLADKATLLAAESESSSDNNTAYLVEVDSVINDRGDSGLFRRITEAGPKFKRSSLLDELFD